ncbi:ragulator complex protein LAMTOR1 [Coturnix japonica]|uniref:ragulator complex protein LAMTOR1 n=1 Tax=Coturnix japonica TaxID=93934 RepID=UPI00077759AA|nr:ragulator complex protein LAMTOR1 [Coturnix japonica]
MGPVRAYGAPVWDRGACAPQPHIGLSPSYPCSNIIDVSAADSQGMEQHEYMDRARQYSTRLAMLSNSLTHWKKLPLLPSLTNQPHQVLASEPVPYTDLQQVRGVLLQPPPHYNHPLWG